MRLTLTVHVPRRRPLPVDVCVEWVGEHTAGDLCRALAEHLGESVDGLSSRGQLLDASAVVGLPPLVHGASVVVAGVPPPEAELGPLGRAGTAHVAPVAGAAGGLPRTVTHHGLLDLVVTGGPDAGRAHPLVPPGVSIGRAPVAGLALADHALSRTHAVVDVGPSGVSVRDAGSTNGVFVDGTLVTETTTVDAASTIVVGSSTLRLRRASGRGLPTRSPGDGTLIVQPSTWPAPDPGPVEIVCPPTPGERHRVRIPWIAALVPVPIGVGLAFLLGPYLLIFALMGPLVLLTSALGDRWGAGRAHRRAVAAHAVAVHAARDRLRAALVDETARLHRGHPDPHQVLRVAEGALPGLWSAGPSDGALPIRLGTGSVATRVVWTDGPDRVNPAADNAPVVLDLAACRAVAVVGPPLVTDGHLRMLLGQVCTTSPPQRLSIAVVAPDTSWAWVDLLPHAHDVADLLAPPGPASASTHHRVLVIPEPAKVVGGVHPLITRALDADVLVVVACTDRAEVPEGVSTVVEPGGNGRHVLHHDAKPEDVDVVIDAVGPWWADRVARALAPLRSAEGGVGSLPRSISLSQAVAADLSPPALAARWRARARSGTPTAVVGVTADGLFSIDLVHDGPHVLIGGTTGSGKSEFLRTLVTSLALACPPEDLTFVLVDFKGGAAFGPCASLPHVVGLVTDLDEHLVSRALRSLGAELRRRERIFATVGASDLEGYHRAQGPGTESVPRLVIVIDELKALVDEVPDFVSGLVRLAALGRSLGVHLVLATQRPSGAVTAEIQANVNLRIAFRVRDRTDSVDILEDPAAAGIRSSTPGRALSRGGDGILVMFQAATLGDGDSAAEPFLRVSAPDVQEDARMPAPSVHAVTPLVDAARRAHALRGGAAPRTPWLPPLPDLVHPVSEPSIPAHDPAPRATIGLVDEPEHQQVSPLVWTPGDGSWLLSGRPGSGRTTALRTLVLSLARRLPSDRLHIHVIDPSAALADLEALPHVGTRLTPTRRRSLAALIVHLRHEVEVRRSTPDQATDAPLVVLVIDGWEQFTEAQGALDPEGVVDAVLAILRDGASVGVVGVVAGGRSLLQPRWSAIAATTLLLGTIDPLDAALAGLRLADVPREPPRGRAVRLADRREVQIATSTAQDSCEVAAHSSRGGTGRSTDAGQPWAWRDLPDIAHRPAGGPSGADGHHHDATPGPTPLGLSLGLRAPSHEVWRWDPSDIGRRLLVSGPPNSGRTTTLATLALSAQAAGLPVAVIRGVGHDDRPQAKFGSAAVLSTRDVAQLVELRQRHHDLVLLVDDADQIGDDCAMLPLLTEIAELVDRDRGLLVVATNTASLAVRFRGLDVDLARRRTGILLTPERGDGDLLGARLTDVPPRFPGRALVVARGDVTEVQVFTAPPTVQADCSG